MIQSIDQVLLAGEEYREMIKYSEKGPVESKNKNILAL
jgi:hypothetical protein